VNHTSNISNKHTQIGPAFIAQCLVRSSQVALPPYRTCVAGHQLDAAFSTLRMLNTRLAALSTMAHEPTSCCSAQGVSVNAQVRHPGVANNNSNNTLRRKPLQNLGVALASSGTNHTNCAWYCPIFQFSTLAAHAAYAGIPSAQTVSVHTVQHFIRQHAWAMLQHVCAQHTWSCAVLCCVACRAGWLLTRQCMRITTGSTVTP
jgi:hypothetical protein